MLIKKLGKAGDTIVEVLIATAVLGFVMGGAYSLTSRSLQTSRDSQERLEALKFAEGQVEYLKSEARTKTDFNTLYRTVGSNYCFQQGTGAKNAAGSAPCNVGTGSRYKISIEYVNDSAFTDPNKRFGNFNVNVNWDRIGGGQDRIVINYQT